MLRKFGSHLRDQWIGTIALFLVLGGGTAWAVDGTLDGQNTVGTEDIINQEVRSTDIKDGGVTFFDIGANQVHSEQVKDNTLGSSDVGETLAISPSAGHTAGKYSVTMSTNNGLAVGRQGAGTSLTTVFLTGGVPGDEFIYLNGTDLHAAGSVGVLEGETPDAPTSSAQIFARDDGSGNTELMVIFPNGDVDRLGTELAP